MLTEDGRVGQILWLSRQVVNCDLDRGWSIFPLSLAERLAPCGWFEAIEGELTVTLSERLFILSVHAIITSQYSHTYGTQGIWKNGRDSGVRSNYVGHVCSHWRTKGGRDGEEMWGKVNGQQMALPQMDWLTCGTRPFLVSCDSPRQSDSCLPSMYSDARL